MLTYDLEKSKGMPLYESLYRHLRQDILSGVLPKGSRLPSKRDLARNLKLSKITVENAYDQLLAEGYIVSRQRVGYFVDYSAAPQTAAADEPISQEPEQRPLLDLTANGPADFPFSVWSRLQRGVMLDYGTELLRSLPNQGCPELRRAIARHLQGFRGMQVSAENIIIGAGTDFLYNLLIQLLGREGVYAVEEPGFDKIRRIYAAGGVDCRGVGMDGEGVLPEQLGQARVLHISPAHHFPTGVVTSMARRQALLAWAEERGGYIIEDDYDCEFRFDAHPMPAMQTQDHCGRVIYMNSFSKSLAPSIRIGYMVLPPALAEKFRRELGFYGCTVASFEQYTLARFLELGYFDRHINRLRKFYRSRRDRVLEQLKGMEISETDAGLHFILKVDTNLSDEALVARWAEQGIRVRALSSFYHGEVPESARHRLLINYSGLDESQLWRLGQLTMDN